MRTHPIFTILATGLLCALPLAAAAPPGPLHTLTPVATFRSTTAVAIPDASPAGVTATLVVTTPLTSLWDVDLVTDLQHTFPGDLVVTLTSPAGTAVTITSRNGSTADDCFAGTRWDDDAPLPVTDASHTSGVVSTPLVPEGALGRLIGEDPNGTWTLRVVDAVAGDSGTLAGWSLVLTTILPTPVGTATPFIQPQLVPIPDATAPDPGVLSTLVVAEVEPFLCELEMLTVLDHNAPSDLEVALTSPAGTTVTVTTDNGGKAFDVFEGTTWTDRAGQTVTDALFAPGVAATPLVPEGAFAAFIGEDPNGEWTLSILDDTPGISGELEGWSLTVTTCPGFSALDIPTAPPLGLGMLGLLLAAAGVYSLRRGME